MNVSDVVSMDRIGSIKPDSDIFDILWWLKIGNGKKQSSLYPSDSIYPDDVLYPVLPESN